MHPITINVSYCQTYLISGPAGYVLVDTGNDSKAWRIFNYLSREKIAPQKIKFIILTHVHFDHAMGLAALKRATGAKIIVHRNEAGLLKDGFTAIPKGTGLVGRTLFNLGTRFYPRIMKFHGVEADILVDDELDLNQFGFDLKVIHTPGHTEGSISVVRKGVYAIVGDVMMGRFFGSFWPIFANDESQLKRTWVNLLSLGVSFFYPGHGRRIRSGEIKARVGAVGR